MGHATTARELPANAVYILRRWFTEFKRRLSARGIIAAFFASFLLRIILSFLLDQLLLVGSTVD